MDCTQQFTEAELQNLNLLYIVKFKNLEILEE